MSTRAIEQETPPRPSSGQRLTVLLESHRLRTLGLVAALVVLLAAVMASLAIGSMSIPVREVIAALTAFDDSDAHVIVTELRVPRTEIGLLVGAALGAAGALMQGVTRNPLAEPGILGINAGAAFAVVIAIFLLDVSSVVLYAWFALLGARPDRAAPVRARRVGPRRRHAGQARARGRRADGAADVADERGARLRHADAG